MTERPYSGEVCGSTYDARTLERIPSHPEKQLCRISCAVGEGKLNDIVRLFNGYYTFIKMDWDS